MKSMRPQFYSRHLEESTLGDLFLFRMAAAESGAPHLRLPSLAELLDVPTLHERLTRHIESGIAGVVGWDIKFKDARAFRKFCLSRFGASAPKFNVYRSLCELYRPGRLPQDAPSAAAVWASQMLEAFAFGSYQRYKDCVAATVQRFFECTNECFDGGCFLLTSEFYLDTPPWSEFQGRPGRRHNRHGRRRLGGLDWMDLYRQYIPDEYTSDDALNKSAARGRTYLNESAGLEIGAVFWPGLRPGVRQGTIVESASIAEEAMLGTSFPSGWHVHWYMFTRTDRHYWIPTTAPMTPDHFAPMKHFDFE